jgi:hypothetical protein
MIASAAGRAGEGVDHGDLDAPGHLWRAYRGGLVGAASPVEVECEDFYNSHRPHRGLDQAALLRPLPDGITDLDHFRVRRHDRVGGVIHEYRLVT